MTLCFCVTGIHGPAGKDSRDGKQLDRVAIKSEKRNSETGNSVDSEWREKRVKYHCRKLTNQIPTKDQT